MRKGMLAAMTLAAAAAIGSVSLLMSGGAKGVKALQYGEWRIAIADRECPQEGEQGFDYLQEHCKLSRTLHGHCLCATDDEDPLVGELGAAEIAALPDKYFMRVAVCSHDEDGQEVRSVEYAALDATVPPGWTCKLIASKIPRFAMSYRPVRSWLLEKLQEKCCADCPASCWIQEGSWKQCPYCLLDDTCDSFCPEE